MGTLFTVCFTILVLKFSEFVWEYLNKVVAPKLGNKDFEPAAKLPVKKVTAAIPKGPGDNNNEIVGYKRICNGYTAIYSGMSTGRYNVSYFRQWGGSKIVNTQCTCDWYGN